MSTTFLKGGGWAEPKNGEANLGCGKFKEFNETLKDLVAGKDTPEVRKFLEKYEIKPKEVANVASHSRSMKKTT